MKLTNFKYLKQLTFEFKKMIQAKMKRSFVPSENSDFSNNKRLKLSYNDYAEISYKFNASNAKSASTNDSDESQSDSMCELIKDIENFNLRRKNKINEMFYPKNEISKVKSSSRITNLTNNFNFKRVFEKIQNDSKVRPIKNATPSINSSYHSNKNEKLPPKLKDLIFNKKTNIERENRNRNIRNISSLKKSKLLEKIHEKNKILEIDEENNFMDEDQGTPTFSKDKSLENSQFHENKEFENDNYFLPKIKSTVNFSLFRDLNPNVNMIQKGLNKPTKPTKK